MGASVGAVEETGKSLSCRPASSLMSLFGLDMVDGVITLSLSLGKDRRLLPTLISFAEIKLPVEEGTEADTPLKSSWSAWIFLKSPTAAGNAFFS